MSACPPGSDEAFGPRVDPKCRDLDFTLKFEDIFLTCLPAAIFILLLPSRIVPPLLRKRKQTFSPRSKLLLACKLTTLTALFATQLAFLVLRVRDRSCASDASLAADILNAIATGAALVLSFIDHRQSPRPSTLLSLYLSASVLLGIAKTRTLWLMAPQTPIPIIITIALGLIVAALLLESMPRGDQVLAPEQLSGFWSRTVFAWLATTLSTGYARIIGLDDIPILDTKLESGNLRKQLVSAWAKYDTRGSHSLLFACLRSYFFSFLSPIIPRICLTAFTFSQPFLVNTTVSFVGEGDHDPNYGKALIGAWALVYLGIATSTSIYQYQNYRFIARLRGGLVALIYQQALHTRVFESGEVTAVTLMSTDVERLANGMKSAHEVWGSLLDIAIASWLLGLQLSVACLAPIFLVVVFIGITSKHSVAMMKAQLRWVEKVQDRLRVSSAMLSDMKAVKMIGLSGVMAGIIQSLRRSEIETSKAYRKLLIVMLLLSLTPINLAPVLTFGIYAIIAVFWQNESLLAAKAFSSVALISLLTTPVVVFIQTLPMVVQCLGSFGRIQEFCNYSTVSGAEKGSSHGHGQQERSDNPPNAEKPRPTSDFEKGTISLRGQSFSWGKDKPAALKNLYVNIPRGHITAIVGAVGGGKSTFLVSLLGELTPVPSTSDKGVEAKEIREPLAYCAHQPWLENGTVRENIIGPSPYDKQWYSTVKLACGLDADIKQLGRGDHTRVGSGGLSLSGGQKQRIALARAVYARCSIVLLDDVFSGMDRHTVEHVSSSLLGSHGILRNHKATVVIATHSHKIMGLADTLIVLEDGAITETGSPTTLLQGDGYTSKLGITALSDDVDDDAKADIKKGLKNVCPDLDSPIVLESSRTSKDTDETDKELPDLRRKNGDFAVYKYYIANAGYAAVFLYTIFITLWMFCTEFSTVIIKWWSEANAVEPNQQLGMWIGLYAMLGVLGTVGAAVAAWFAFVPIISETGTHLHSDLLTTTLNASFRFLTKTDHGELLNRFSQDLELIDMDLPATMVNYTSTAMSCAIKLIILAVFSQYLGVAIPFLATAVYFLQRFYLKTSRQVRLLGIEARAPLVAHFTESVAGAVTIRAFGWQAHYEERCHHRLDASQKPTYLQSCIQHWLGVMLDLLVTVLAVALVGTVVTWHDKFSPGSVGVSLIMVINFSSTLGRLIQNWTKLESSVGAVARIKRFVSDSEPEDSENRTAVLPPQWPQLGAVEFVNLTASYGLEASPTLNHISLNVQPGQHIAICGRTGSGKTSLIVSLMQMLNIQEGQIYVDGVDASTVAYDDLRTRLNVVPQDPFLLPGTIRFNIDPLHRASDDEVIRALTRVGLWDTVHNQGGLDKNMVTSAWSDGQRQLMCLARAIVRKSKILVLDEVTSSVDSETESKIQEIIDTEFKDCSVLAVMHRLSHVSRYDMVALLSDGVLVEYDQPATLINEATQFAELYRSSGS